MDIYTQIKRQNGEAFAKAIRNYDNGIFDIPGIVDMLKYAGRDAEPIMNYLVSLKNVQIKEQENPEDLIALLDKAGYDAYIVEALTDDNNPDFDPNNPKTWKGQNTIIRYFAPKEKLCTFRDPSRHKHYYIINAVKRGADKLKREDFKGKERREDDYGTSVISIQVSKDGGFISIKNRYNHTVQNPDNTFGSNPDMIIPGLSDAIRRRFNVDFSSTETPLPDGFIRIYDQEGKDRIVRYHNEIDGYYFGPSYYVKDGNITRVKSHEILIEHYILNLKDGTVKDVARIESSFPKLFEQELVGKKIQITKDKKGQQYIFADGKEVATIKDGHLVSLSLSSPLKIIPNCFFWDCSSLTSVNLPDGVTEIEDGAFDHCSSLASILLPNTITEIKDGTFTSCYALASINIPEGVTSIGSRVFANCLALTSINIPNGVTKIGDRVFEYCSSLTSIDIPKSVTEIGDETFLGCCALTSINLPEGVTKIEPRLFSYCSSLTSINIPKGISKIRFDAFKMCYSLKNINIPDGVTEIGWSAFEGCSALTSINIPDSIVRIGYDAFSGCDNLTITCTKKQEKMIRKSGFKGPIKIIPVALTQQPTQKIVSNGDNNRGE